MCLHPTSEINFVQQTWLDRPLWKYIRVYPWDTWCNQIHCVHVRLPKQRKHSDLICVKVARPKCKYSRENRPLGANCVNRDQWVEQTAKLRTITVRSDYGSGTHCAQSREMGNKTPRGSSGGSTALERKVSRGPRHSTTGRGKGGGPVGVAPSLGPKNYVDMGIAEEPAGIWHSDTKINSSTCMYKFGWDGVICGWGRATGNTVSFCYLWLWRGQLPRVWQAANLVRF